MLPVWWKNPADKKSKCGQGYHSHNAQENECAIQANLFFPWDCVSSTAGIVDHAGFVMHAAVKTGQNTDAEAECKRQNDPEAA